MHADSGCLQWVFQAEGPVRAAMHVVPYGKGHALLFGTQIGWFYAVDAENGKMLWRKRIEDHDTARLTGTAAVNGDTVYVPVASWEETRSSIRITFAARSAAAW